MAKYPITGYISMHHGFISVYCVKTDNVTIDIYFIHIFIAMVIQKEKQFKEGEC